MEEGLVEAPLDASAIIAPSSSVVVWEAVVYRCGCALPANADRGPIHGRDSEGNLLPCPTPRLVVDLHTISYHDTRHPILSAITRAVIWLRRHVNKRRENE